jgi:hypothetical protein
MTTPQLVNACDLYLLIAMNFPIGCHDDVVAEYRKYGGNVVRNAALMLRFTRRVLHAQRRYVRRSKQYEEVHDAGMKHSREYFGEPLVAEGRAQLHKREWQEVMRALAVLLRYDPNGFASVLCSRYNLVRLRRRPASTNPTPRSE